MRSSQEADKQEIFVSKEENFFIRQDRIKREQEELRKRGLTQFVQEDYAKMQSEGKNVFKGLPKQGTSQDDFIQISVQNEINSPD